jgi:hypothetical protein
MLDRSQPTISAAMTSGYYASVKDINAALRALGHEPLETDALVAVSQVAREPFLELLQSCVQNAGAEGSKKKLADWIACINVRSRASIATLGLKENLQAMASIGYKRPNRFLTALAAASDSNHARHAEAKAFVSEALSATPMPVSPASSGDDTRQEQLPLSPPPTSTTSARPSSQKEGQREFDTYKVYGANYVLCFNAIDGKDQRPGIMVDAAYSASGVNRWEDAIHLWLDERELGGVLAVFRRWCPSVEYANHGPRKDKVFKLEWQRTHFFCSVSERGARAHPVRGVKIEVSHANMLAGMTMRQLIAAQPTIPPDQVFETIRTLHGVAVSQGSP